MLPWRIFFSNRWLSAIVYTVMNACLIAFVIFTFFPNVEFLKGARTWTYWICVITMSFLLFLLKPLDRQRVKPKDGEVVLITGCDTGLGYSLVFHLRKIGFRVIAAVHNFESPGADLLKAHPEVYVLPLDITIDESVTKFRNAVSKYLDANDYVLRGFVNNAGVMIFGEFEWQTEDQARHQIEVNVLGTMRVTRAFLPIIRKYSTRIIVVTSHCASEPLPGVATYGASKAALNAWATSLRVELKKFSINVVSFVPGSFIGQSNLLSQQRDHFVTMAKSMSEETKELYNDYFSRYTEYLNKLVPSNLPEVIPDPFIYDAFDRALLEVDPRPVYRSEPFRYMLYRIMFKISPTKLRDYLVMKFVKLPSWKESDVHSKCRKASIVPTEI